jgi:FMN phosphatase YigB (HAD superfamily)
MKLDGIVLDLDDTLYDTTRLLIPWADRRAVAAMRAAGLDLDEETALARLLELRAAGVVRTFAALAAEHGADDACVAPGEDAWFVYDPPPMTLEPDVARALDELAAIAPLALYTMGDVMTQHAKVGRLGVAPRFAEVRYVPVHAPGGKTAALSELIAHFAWTPSRVVVCGDRPDADVRAGNRNGCLTVLLRRDGSEFAGVAPESQDDLPWRTIAHVAELPALLR